MLLLVLLRVRLASARHDASRTAVFSTDNRDRRGGIPSEITLMLESQIISDVVKRSKELTQLSERIFRSEIQ